MKQEATNTFGEGMIMDLNPLTTPNNVLTSALNATMITYNGNEFVLQNDMGNGRVETAYLPSGYVPIGIKEYGGIIYVASYNPLTNKGQIGSFPSPERNISSEDIQKPDITINPESSFGFTEESGISTAYKKLKLTENIVRPGDKFVLRFYANGAIWNDMRSLITNFDNYSELQSGVRLLSIDVAVQDSSGNLQSITNRLKRFNSQGTLIESPKEGEGYFMLEDSTSKPSDELLEDLRKAVTGFNIYNNKLYGNLYLIVTVNTIDSFELVSQGTRNQTDKEVVWRFETNEVSETYKNLTISPNKAAVMLSGYYEDTFPTNFITKDNDYWKGLLVSLKSKKEAKTIYWTGREPNMRRTNLLVNDLDKDDVLEYSITPIMTFGRLENFTKTGSIDLSKIGSGEVNLVEWKYFNDTYSNQITISYGLESYMRDKEYIEYIDMNFYSLNSEFKIANYVRRVKSRKNYNGAFSEIISYEDLNYGDLYLVQIVIKINTSDTPKTIYRFLYTSSWFNQYYMSVKDFRDISLDLKLIGKVTSEMLSKVTTPKEASSSELYYFKPPTSENNNPPFYRLQSSDTNITYSLNVEYKLESQESFPFIFDKSKTTNNYETTNETFELSGLNNQYKGAISQELLNSMILSSDISTTSASKYPITGNSAYGVNYSIINSAEPILEVKLRTVSQIAGDGRFLHITKNVHMYESCANVNNCDSMFGYSTEEGIIRLAYSIKAYYHKGSRHGWNVVRYNTISDQTGITLDKGSYVKDRANRHWVQQADWIIEPHIKERLAVIGINSPTILALSSYEGNSDHGLTPIGHPRQNYWSGLIWKDIEGRYCIINSYYPIDGANNALGSWKRGFKEIYMPQDTTLDVDIYAISNYIYTNTYTVKSNASVSVNITTPDLQEALLHDNYLFGKQYIESLIAKSGLEEASTILKETGVNNVTLVSITQDISSLVINSSIKSPNIANNVQEFENAPDAIPDVIGRTEDSLITEDHNGRPLMRNKLYRLKEGILIDPANAEDSQLATSTLEGVTGKDMINYLTKYFVVKYDPITKANHIYINRNAVESVPYRRNTPYIGSDKSPFELAAETDGYFLKLRINGTCIY